MSESKEALFQALLGQIHWNDETRLSKMVG